MANLTRALKRGFTSAGDKMHKEDPSGNTFRVDIESVVNLASNKEFDNTLSGYPETNVQDAIYRYMQTPVQQENSYFKFEVGGVYTVGSGGDFSSLDIALENFRRLVTTNNLSPKKLATSGNPHIELQVLSGAPPQTVNLYHFDYSFIRITSQDPSNTIEGSINILQEACGPVISASIDDTSGGNPIEVERGSTLHIERLPGQGTLSFTGSDPTTGRILIDSMSQLVIVDSETSPNSPAVSAKLGIDRMSCVNHEHESPWSYLEFSEVYLNGMSEVHANGINSNMSFECDVNLRDNSHVVLGTHPCKVRLDLDKLCSFTMKEPSTGVTSEIGQVTADGVSFIKLFNATSPSVSGLSIIGQSKLHWENLQGHAVASVGPISLQGYSKAKLQRVVSTGITQSGASHLVTDADSTGTSNIPPNTYTSDGTHIKES